MRLQTQFPSDTKPRPGRLTRAEIFQQPELWPTTLALVGASDWAATPGAPTIVTGAGTSAYAADAIAQSWPNARAIPTTDLLAASPAELARTVPGFAESGVLVSLGRSGDSPESVAVVNRVQRMCPAVEHLAITCNAQGKLANTAGVRAIVLDPRSNDQSLAMTSSFTNLVLAGLCLQQFQTVAGSLAQVCKDVQSRLEDMDREAERIARGVAHQRVVLLASRPLSALADEASLKILEMTGGRTVTLAETFLGLRHGPMSFLRTETLVVCWMSADPKRRQYERDVLAELKHKGLGHIVGISSESEPDVFDEWIQASAHFTDEPLRIPFEIPFAQLLAYHLSIQAGLDPDNPSPMGAITRVVGKFRIYDDEAD